MALENELALYVAERLAGEASLQAQAYSWGYIGNADPSISIC